jgi:ribonuclease D
MTGPSGAMAETTEIPLITSRAELESLADHLRAAGRFAFDTEFVSEETYEPVLCLVQVATADRLVAIDPLAFKDLDPFWAVVNDPAVEVVMHAAGEDLRICRFQTGRMPSRVFDVQVAAGLLGFGYPLSLGNLVAAGVGESVFGGETRTDWRRRPLTPAQLRYAMDDVRFLLPLADRFHRELRDLGREAWAEREFADLIGDIENRYDEDRWRKLSGLHHLNRRSLEVARRLHDWRQSEARRQNRPIRQVLRDDLLVAIAKRQPANRQDLEALRDFNRPHLLAKAREILAVVAEAAAVPAADLPELPLRHDEGPGLTMLVNLLAAALAYCCARGRVAVGLVGTTGDLKELVRWHSQDYPHESTPRLASGWRVEVCGESLLDVLAGRQTLRVVDPNAEVPVDLESFTFRSRHSGPG